MRTSSDGGAVERRAAPLALRLAIELQDDLLSSIHDLDRLQDLLTEACDALLAGFQGAIAEIAAGETADAAGTLARVQDRLGNAVTALQFQDMTSQLIDHTHRRLHSCVDRLARDALADDEDGTAVVDLPPLRSNPVTQAEMNVGSIELF
jgi:hypothetical protein